MVGPNGLLVAALRLQVAQWAGSMKQPVTLLATDSAIVGSVAPHYRFPASFEIGAAIPTFIAWWAGRNGRWRTATGRYC